MTQKNEQCLRDFSGLPGDDLVEKGLRDLAAGARSAEALAVALFEPRLRSLGIAVPGKRGGETLNLELYKVLEQQYGTEAHSQYNALLRRVISFASALEREASAKEQGEGKRASNQASA